MIGLLMLIPNSIHAVKMESERYQIESEISIESNKKPVEKNNFVNLNKNDLKEFEQNGFVITSTALDTFSFMLDTTLLSFDSAKANKPVLLSNKATTLSKKGFQISISAEKPLTSFNGSVFKNTKCDNECSSLHAAQWSKKSTFGIGYTVGGAHISEDFKNNTFFRSFADSSKKQPPTLVVRSNGESNLPVDFSFKLNLSSNDTEVYSTVVTIEALPAY